MPLSEGDTGVDLKPMNLGSAMLDADQLEEKLKESSIQSAGAASSKPPISESPMKMNFDSALKEMKSDDKRSIVEFTSSDVDPQDAEETKKIGRKNSSRSSITAKSIQNIM